MIKRSAPPYLVAALLSPKVHRGGHVGYVAPGTGHWAPYKHSLALCALCGNIGIVNSDNGIHCVQQCVLPLRRRDGAHWAVRASRQPRRAGELSRAGQPMHSAIAQSVKHVNRKVLYRLYQ